MVETLLKNWKLIAVLLVIAICIGAWQADRELKNYKDMLELWLKRYSKKIGN